MVKANTPPNCTYTSRAPLIYHHCTNVILSVYDPSWLTHIPSHNITFNGPNEATELECGGAVKLLKPSGIPGCQTEVCIIDCCKSHIAMQIF